MERNKEVRKHHKFQTSVYELIFLKVHMKQPLRSSCFAPEWDDLL